jgi:hypothetical protein
LLGQDASAQQALHDCLRLNPGFTIKRVNANRQSSVPAYLVLRERYLER